MKKVFFAIGFLIFISCKDNKSQTTAYPVVVPQTQIQEQQYYFICIQTKEPKVDLERDKFSDKYIHRIDTIKVTYCSPIKPFQGHISKDQQTMFQDEYENEIQIKIDYINKNLYATLVGTDWTRPEIEKYEGVAHTATLLKFDTYTKASEARHYIEKRD